MSQQIRRSTIAGAVGVVCLGVFWFAILIPKYADALLRPYGLYVWLAVLASAVLLTAVAAILGSKRWLVVAALGAITFAGFFVRVLT
jgi:hypothetical protein